MIDDGDELNMDSPDRADDMTAELADIDRIIAEFEQNDRQGDPSDPADEFLATDYGVLAGDGLTSESTPNGAILQADPEERPTAPLLSDAPLWGTVTSYPLDNAVTVTLDGGGVEAKCWLSSPEVPTPDVAILSPGDRIRVETPWKDDQGAVTTHAINARHRLLDGAMHIDTITRAPADVLPCAIMYASGQAVPTMWDVLNPPDNPRRLKPAIDDAGLMAWWPAVPPGVAGGDLTVWDGLNNRWDLLAGNAGRIMRANDAAHPAWWAGLNAGDMIFWHAENDAWTLLASAPDDGAIIRRNLAGYPQWWSANQGSMAWFDIFSLDQGWTELDMIAAAGGVMVTQGHLWNTHKPAWLGPPTYGGDGLLRYNSRADVLAADWLETGTDAGEPGFVAITKDRQFASVGSSIVEGPTFVRFDKLANSVSFMPAPAVHDGLLMFAYGAYDTTWLRPTAANQLITTHVIDLTYRYKLLDAPQGEGILKCDSSAGLSYLESTGPHNVFVTDAESRYAFMPPPTVRGILGYASSALRYFETEGVHVYFGTNADGLFCFDYIRAHG